MGFCSIHKISNIFPLIIAVLLIGFFECQTPSSSDDNTNDHIHVAGYYTIIKPYKGYQVKLGTVDSIRWTSNQSSSDYVSLYLCNDTSVVQTISSSTLNNGRLAWAPSQTGSMNNCRIKIAKYDEPDKYDFSGSFSIYSDYTGAVVVTSPPQDTAWIDGNTYSIRWATTGNIGSYVKIELYADTALVSTISSQTANDGVHSWTCTASSSGSNYRIKVSSYYDQGIYNFSNTFTISKGYIGSITVTNPVDTSDWTAGSSYSITWTDFGTIGTSVRINLYQDTGLVQQIASSTSNDGAQSWTVPLHISSGDNYRIKIESYYDNAIYDFSDTFSITGIDVDMYEPDNTRDSASSFDSLGIVQSRSLTLNDTDWVAFSGVAGRTYTVQTTGVAVTYVFLYFDQEANYRTYASGSTSTKITAFRYLCDTTGTFYLKIQPYNSTYGYGAYSLKIAEIDPFTCITFTAPTSSTTWSSGSSYSIQWQPDTALFGTLVRLYLCEDTTMVSNITTSNSNTGTQSWSIPANISTSSHYRIRIDSRTYPGIYGFSQKFTVSGINPDNYENDDSRDSASSFDTLGIDQNRSLTLNDTDWVSFSAKKGETYAMQTVGGAITRMYLYYEDNQTLLSSANPSTSTRRTTLVYTYDSAGTYYAMITCYSTSVSYYGEYTLRITEIDPFSIAHFTAPAANTTWSSGTSYTIQWQADTILFDRTVGLALCKDTAFVSAIGNTTNDGDQAWAVPTGIETSNRYRIRMLNYSYQDIIGYSDTFTISGINADTFEVDDSMGQANPIAVNGTVQNHTITLSDSDWVTFPALSGMSYLINTQATFNHRVYLYFNSTANQIDYKYSTVNSFTASPQENGTYYVLVSQYSSYGGPYTISVREYDPNNSVNFINPTSNSTWSAGTSYSIEWTPDTAFLSTTMRLYLYADSTLTTIISLSTPNDGIHPWTVTNGLESGKIYRIQAMNYSNANMYGFSDTFTISGIAPDTFEKDDTTGTAHSISSGALEQHTMPYQDVDWYSLSATASNLYVLETLDSLNTIMALYSPSLAAIATDDNSGDLNNARIVWICNTSDTYYFKVYSSYYGSYRMQVTAHDSTAYKYNIVSPTAGSSIAINDTCDITWNTAIPLGGTVDIFLYNTGGVVMTIEVNTADDNDHAWVIPATVTPATDYQIKIANRTVAEAYGFSGVFSITAKD